MIFLKMFINLIQKICFPMKYFLKSHFRLHALYFNGFRCCLKLTNKITSKYKEDTLFNCRELFHLTETKITKESLTTH